MTHLNLLLNRSFICLKQRTCYRLSLVFSSVLCLEPVNSLSHFFLSYNSDLKYKIHFICLIWQFSPLFLHLLLIFVIFLGNKGHIMRTILKAANKKTQEKKWWIKSLVQTTEQLPRQEWRCFSPKSVNTLDYVKLSVDILGILFVKIIDKCTAFPFKNESVTFNALKDVLQK